MLHGGDMKFPNLVWAAGQYRLAHYQIAAAADMSESRFSRCLSGRADFSSEEQRKLSVVLKYPAAWLFQEVEPPAPVVSGRELRKQVTA
jgi:hypothetical protein